MAGARPRARGWRSSARGHRSGSRGSPGAGASTGFGGSGGTAGRRPRSGRRRWGGGGGRGYARQGHHDGDGRGGAGGRRASSCGTRRRPRRSVGWERAARRERAVRGRGGRVRPRLPLARADGRGGEQRRGRPPRVLRRQRRGAGAGLRGIRGARAPRDRGGGRRRCDAGRRGARDAGVARGSRGGRGRADRDSRAGRAGLGARIELPNGGAVRLALQVPGLHNLRNATAALAAALELGVDLERCVTALERFSGVARRFERVGEARGVMIVDDYAHHPTEVLATLAAARQTFPRRRVVAVFQPHLFSRTALHGEALGRALASADVVVVAPIYGAREQPLPGVTADLVAQGAARAGAATVAVRDRAALVDSVAERVRPGDVVFTLGAGDVTRVGPELLRQLGGAEQP